uniref:FA_desaturase domain-containing protein n=2 Tax=Schistosoma mansoni TaxID=6183 RepID=A0A5K4F2W8_SCHMA
MTSDSWSFFRGVTYLFRIENDEDEWIYDEEPHVSRRKEILSKYPEVKELMGPDIKLAYFSSFEVFLQFIVALWISIYQPSWLLWLFLTYTISGTINHSLGCAIHEVGHNLVFGHKYGKANRLYSIFINLPMGLPIAISYRKYHQAHHRWLGHEDGDADMPLLFEVKLFTHPISRFIWLIIHPIFYAFRPFIKHPLPLTLWEIINFIIQITFDIIIWYYFGIWTLAYFIIGTVLGLGLHPLSGHFISEHYLFADQQATHSYYGIGNYLMYNLGYHVEHHDFPYIAYTKLPKLKMIANEYYEQLPYHKSLCKVLWDFVFAPNNGPQAHCVTSQDLSKPEIYKNQYLSSNLMKCTESTLRTSKSGQSKKPEIKKKE